MSRRNSADETERRRRADEDETERRRRADEITIAAMKRAEEEASHANRPNQEIPSHCFFPSFFPKGRSNNQPGPSATPDSNLTHQQTHTNSKIITFTQFKSIIESYQTSSPIRLFCCINPYRSKTIRALREKMQKLENSNIDKIEQSNITKLIRECGDKKRLDRIDIFCNGNNKSLKSTDIVLQKLYEAFKAPPPDDFELRRYTQG